MNPRLVTLLILVFFLGLPVAGLIFVWKYAHVNIESSADPFARQIARDILEDWDAKLLDDLGTLPFRQSEMESDFDKMKPKLGRFVAIENFSLVKSTVGERIEAIWQFVHYQGKVKYEKGSAALKMTVARRTMNPEWRIESLALTQR